MDAQPSLADKPDIASLMKDNANGVSKSRENLC